ncbi:MAG: hypothetical protein HY908_07520 [Myxococcales bacterium]|nr:hypothetical protein [Myxococcales bacterium]
MRLARDVALPKEALPYLRVAARGCFAFDTGLAWVRNAVPLGQALAETGDREGACGAYRSVLDRWGQARPRSVTAERAKRLAAELGCGAR